MAFGLVLADASTLVTTCGSLNSRNFPSRVPGLCAGTSGRSHSVPISALKSVRNADRRKRFSTVERVLRYVDGNVRRIRYPVPPPEEDDFFDEAASYVEGCSSPSQWGRDEAWDIPGLAAAAAAAKRATPKPALKESTSGRGAAPVQQPPAEQQEKARDLPSSPAALLRYLSSPEYLRAQNDLWQRVNNSYRVFDGSPWVQSKPLYLLATQQQGSDAGLTFTMRTRVAQQGAEDELTKVLGRKRPDGRSVISVSEIRDGVLAFEDEADAERFGSLLEADGHRQVMLARCDSHELFRSVAGVRAVVVLFPRGASVPLPDQLAVALRGQQSIEDSVDDTGSL